MLKRGLPPAPYEIAYEPGLMVPAADGTPLPADHWFPLADGDFPTLLLRTPYGRGFPWAAMYGARFAEQGFHVLLQSCRGSGGSRGDFARWRNEPADGQAAVAWLRRQPWFTGVLGTIGASYLGYTQWALAVDPPPELRAMVVQVAPHDPYRTAWPGGVFALETALVAGVGLAWQSRETPAFLRATLRLTRQLRKVTRTLPLIDAYVPAVGERTAVVEEPLTHPERDDPHWQGTDLGGAIDRLTVPTNLLGGWHDLCLDQTIEQYVRLRRAGCEASLLIGPWTHTSAFDRGWPHVFPESLAWLRAHLTGDRSGLRPTRVRVHVGGADEWRDLRDWPPPAGPGRRWYLHPDGRLGARASTETAAPLSFRYDPSDPTPSRGGQVLNRDGGSRDNSALEARADVLLFTTEPLTEPVEILGPVSAELAVGTDTGYADIFARLCDVDVRGRSRNVCDGLVRLPAGATGPVAVTVAMSSTAYRFAAGHRIRLQISGGAHPRFNRNTGTGERAATATRLVPTRISVHFPSALVLPVSTDLPAADEAG
ncbi:CocE/NonD family hydrolase [Micromonospora sp. NPDC004704]